MYITIFAQINFLQLSPWLVLGLLLALALLVIWRRIRRIIRHENSGCGSCRGCDGRSERGNNSCPSKKF